MNSKQKTNNTPPPKNSKNSKSSKGKKRAIGWQRTNNSDDTITGFRNDWYAKKQRDIRKKRLNPHLGHEVEDDNFSYGLNKALESYSSLHSLVADFKNVLGVTVPDQILFKLELFTTLAMSLSLANSTQQIALAITSFLHGLTNRSVLGQVYSYLSEILDIALTPQLGEEVDHDMKSDKHGWFKYVEELRTDWRQARASKLFTNFSRALGLLVTLGLCEASDVTFSFKNYICWEPCLKTMHGNCSDIIDAFIETSTFFVENMYACFKQRSLRPLLIGSSEAMRLDEEFNLITHWWSLERCGNLRSQAKVETSEFDVRLRSLEDKVKNILPCIARNSFEYTLMNRKYMQLLEMRSDFVLHQVNCGVRRSPYALQIYGESSQGKTTYADQVIDALLTSAGLPVDKSRRCAVNAGDKFMSNWTSDKLVMIVDDIGNEKSQFVERSPLRILIDTANNQMAYAEKADLKDKGRVFIAPEIVLATTNVPDMDAGIYSNCPFSVQRRFLRVTVKVRQEFATHNGTLDPQKVQDYHAKHEVTPMFDDIWLLTIERARKPNCLNAVGYYQTITWIPSPDATPIELKDVSFQIALNFLIEDFNNHRRLQNNLIDTMKNRSVVLKKCGVNGCNQIMGHCEAHKLHKQLGTELASFAVQGFMAGFVARPFKILYDTLYGNLLDHLHNLEQNCTTGLLLGAKWFMWKHGWLSLIPTSWVQHPWFRSAYLFLNSRNMAKSYAMNTTLTIICFIMTILSTYCAYKTQAKHNNCANLCMSVVLTTMFCYLMIRQICLASNIREKYLQKLTRANTIAPALQQLRDTRVKQACQTVACVGGLYMLIKIFKKWHKVTRQGSLMPTKIEDVQFRDEQENVWSQVTTRELPITDLAKTVTLGVLEKIVAKNLVYLRTTIDDKIMCGNALFLKSNVLLMPHHYLTLCGGNLKCELLKCNPDSCGGRFTANISPGCTYRIPRSDYVMCYVPTGGSFRDLTKHFPLANMPSIPVKVLRRDKHGAMTEMHGRTFPGTFLIDNCFMKGGHYEVSCPTFKGMCGSMLLAETKGAVIVGMHLGGADGQKLGAYGTITQNYIQIGYERLRRLEGVVLSGSAEKFEVEIFDKRILGSEPIEPKSPLNYLPEHSQIEYYGSCGGKSRSSSDVRVTPMSEHIMTVCGVPNIYQGPKFKPDWFGWQECLANMSAPGEPFPYSLLHVAVKDYKESVIPLFKNDLWKDCAPLNDHENLNGKVGVKFIDAIKLGTSIGYPLTGPKRDHVIELEPTEDKPCNRIFTEVVMDEIIRCENCYIRGERAYPISKACKKDEILSKDKCRIFYSNPIALTWLVRKYFLPLIRVFQMNPLVTECAVGINCFSPEWDEFYAHVLKHGKDRLIGGDYGKYDQKIPSQLILAALRILIDCAAICKYEPQDLRTMEAMAGDIAFAVIAYNGDLIGLTEGTHISGNSLTVMLNGIVGCLNMRAYYYSVNPYNSMFTHKFRDVINLSTYGDDNIGSVSPKINNFTIKGLSEFLAQYGQIYTMPDKESKLVDFLPFDQFEFLKRKSVYVPEIGGHVGALLDKSIFKSLHCYMRGKKEALTEAEAMASNIDGALREWFCHGRENYDKRLTEMRKVAELAGISHVCTELNVSFDDRVERWKYNYIEEKTHKTQSEINTSFIDFW